MKRGIYRIKNLINEKVYIGQSDNLTNRKQNHFYWLNRGEHHNEYLQKSYNKYGKENFIFEIIEETDDLDIRELHWLNEYGGVNSKLNYNLKDPLSKEWSDYVRIEQSKKMLGENNPNFGNRWSDEKKKNQSKERKGITLEEKVGKEKADLVKQKMSKSQEGRTHKKESIEKIRQANVGEKNPAYGKGDRQKGEKNPMWGKESSKRISIVKLDLENNFLKDYPFLIDVKKDGFNFGNVGSVCKGKLKTSGGFKWMYKEDYLKLIQSK